MVVCGFTYHGLRADPHCRFICSSDAVVFFLTQAIEIVLRATHFLDVNSSIQPALALFYIPDDRPDRVNSLGLSPVEFERQQEM